MTRDGVSNVRSAFLLATVVLVAGVVISLGTGAVTGWDPQVFWELRLPRLLAGLAVGMALAISGAALQSVFANPLAEPYTLGISSGSALGAVIGLSIFPELEGAGAFAGFLGALVFTGVLLSASYRKGANAPTLLLVGVMLGFLGSSLVALWMALADPTGVASAVYWLMGDLSRARLEVAGLAFCATLVLGILLMNHSAALDAFLLGEEEARSVGVPVESERRTILLLVSLLIGLSVGLAGMVGFVGLLVPHLARARAGALHHRLIPLCALWGGALLVLADALGRRVAAPQELPVGVVTALLGVPAFLVFWLKRKRGSA